MAFFRKARLRAKERRQESGLGSKSGRLQAAQLQAERATENYQAMRGQYQNLIQQISETPSKWGRIKLRFKARLMRRTLRRLMKIEARSSARMGRRERIVNKKEVKLTNTRRELYGEQPPEPESEPEPPDPEE